MKVAALDGTAEVTLDKVHAVPRLPVSCDNLVTSEQASRWEHLADVPLHHPDGVDKAELLIGQDCPFALIVTEVVHGGPGEPYAARTRLGWTIAGPINEGEEDVNHSSNLIVATSPGSSSLGGPLATRVVPDSDLAHWDSRDPDRRLEARLERLWKIELGIYDETRGRSQEDQAVLRRWEENVTVVDGHYQLPIPFRSEQPNLPEARTMAEKRLNSLRRKLDKNSTLKSQYVRGIQDLLDRGFAEKVPAEELSRHDGGVWYLPHHPVINPNKDKPRIVFDCAAQHRGVSLNSQVSSGPDLTNSLVGVLLRFRQYPVAFMGDVEAMFHQVKVVPRQRDALRFLWWPGGDTSCSPEVYRMTVHLFGGCLLYTSPSPRDS